MLTIRTGMKVVGTKGDDAGRVKIVQDGSFVLDRPDFSDVVVPFDACARVEGDTVWLRVEAIDVYRQGWQGVPPEGDRARVSGS